MAFLVECMECKSTDVTISLTDGVLKLSCNNILCKHNLTYNNYNKFLDKNGMIYQTAEEPVNISRLSRKELIGLKVKVINNDYEPEVKFGDCGHIYDVNSRHIYYGGHVGVDFENDKIAWVYERHIVAIK